MRGFGGSDPGLNGNWTDYSAMLRMWLVDLLFESEEDSANEVEWSWVEISLANYCFLLLIQGQNGFEELRRYVKQGGDFGKDLMAILQER